MRALETQTGISAVTTRRALCWWGLYGVAGAVVLGLIVPVVGLTQRELLPGSGHVVIEVVHLLLGLGMLGLAENLAVRAKARLAPVG